jgi:hypothetical protein
MRGNNVEETFGIFSAVDCNAAPGSFGAPRDIQFGLKLSF